MPTPTQKRCVGIDVSKHHWDVATTDNRHVRRFDANQAGLALLLAWLDTQQPTLVCLESTGGYEALLVEGLHQQGLPTAVLNPRRVRDFARATGQLAKTDAIDAAVLARFAAAVDPTPTEPPSDRQRRLKTLRARRQQVQQTLTQEKNRLGVARDEETREWVRRSIGFLQEQLGEIDQRLAEATQEDPEFRRRHQLLVSVPGVGPTTANGLIAELPELGSMNRGQAAKLVGLAPLNRDSGVLRGKRRIGGGRSAVRRSLYMATLVATRHNPLIRRHYQHLLQRGKAKMTALVACMRKLLLILNAIVKKQTPWKNTLPD
ncbi:MAG: IS110 family transposase [Actinobacteria bacterium]|nr:IS110 family transposase [Actinomycetota bacterium]